MRSQAAMSRAVEAGDRLGHEPGQVPFGGGAQTPHRGEMDLLVEDQAAFVDVAVEVDGQLGDAGQRLVEPHQQPIRRCGARAGRTAPGRGRARS